MPHDGQSNLYLLNGLQQFSNEHNLDLDITFSDHRHESIQRTVEYINNIKPDICLFLYLNELESFIDYVECPMKCGWIFDVTFDGKEIPESTLRPGIDKLDHFFSICPEHAVRCGGFWVPEGCDPCSHYPIHTEKSYDITFVGQVAKDTPHFRSRGFVHLDRDIWLRDIGCEFGKSLKVFGPNVGDTHSREWHTGKSLSSAWENNVVATASKINLGHSGWPRVKYSWSARDYRIMAAEGFLITNRIAGHEEFFTDGVNIVIYEDTMDCINKIEYYKGKDSLREKIAQAGRDLVLSEFTFKHSMEKIFTHLEVL